MTLVRRARVTFLMLAALLPLAAHAQKKPITQADWDRWQTIAAPTLSPDGKWAAYTLNPRVGDGEFVVRSTSTASEYRVSVGYTNRENNTPGAERGRGGAAGGPPPGAGGRGGRGGGGGGPTGLGPFSADGRHAFVLVTQPPRAEVDSIERAQRASGRGGQAGRGAQNAQSAASPSAPPTS